MWTPIAPAAALAMHVTGGVFGLPSSASGSSNVYPAAFATPRSW